MTKVLVTGATGFVATHTILQLLDKGYEVRGTARNASKAEKLNKILSEYADKPIEIELVSADLTRDEGWDAAMDGIEFVQHIASPFPPAQPRSADELIIPARDGALRALKAAKAAGSVKRVVLTSSIAAVDNGYGKDRPQQFDETNWTQLENGPHVPYIQSKTIAEQAAWDYINSEGAGLEMATICPSAVMGPIMSKDVSTSIGLVLQPLQGKIPGLPRMHQGVVDVRDIAAAHIAAMEKPEAAGERFIVSEASLWLTEVGEILAEAFPDRKIPSRQIPDWQVRLLSWFNPSLVQIAQNLGRTRIYNTQKSKDILGIEYISAKDANLASAHSAIKFGLA